MIRLSYISTARPGTDDFAASAILAKSRSNNRRDGLTGLLLFDGKRFLQALEGDEPQVLATLARIKRDPHHYACVELSRSTITARAFGMWDMAWQRLSRVDEQESLAVTVDRMVAQVTDANVRAHFMSFARIERPAA